MRTLEVLLVLLVTGTEAATFCSRSVPPDYSFVSVRDNPAMTRRVWIHFLSVQVKYFFYNLIN